MNNLINRLKTIAISKGSILSVQDEGVLENQIELKRSLGWTDEEIKEYLVLTEEVDPTLDEEAALRQMKKVIEKVQKRQA